MTQTLRQNRGLGREGTLIADVVKGRSFIFGMTGGGKVLLAAVFAMVMCTSAAETGQDAKPGPTFGRKVENTFRNWKLEELPAAVQKTARDQGFGHKIKDIDREDRTGRTIWEVQFDGGSSGPTRKVHIDNEGKLVDGDGKPIASGRPSATQVNSSASTNTPPPPGNSKSTRCRWTMG